MALSQFINYDGYRAMFEAQGKNRMGLLLWMSHPCWPSFVWQTYDYYFDQSGGYFGSKKGSEPLHIQWNPVDRQRRSGQLQRRQRHRPGCRGRNPEHGRLRRSGRRRPRSIPRRIASSRPSQMEYPAGLTPVHFIRLKLTRGGQTISDNFYLRGLEEYNFKAIRDLPKVNVTASVKVERQGARWILTTELKNTSNQPALMVRVKAVREKSGDRILPALYSENYVALMPGERRSIRAEVADADTRGERPRMVVEGFNTTAGRGAAGN